MEFYESTTKTGLVDDVLYRTGTNIAEFPLVHITRYLNEGYSRVAYIIINADGRMQWDDANHTNQPIATTSLVANQEDYNVFSATPSALQDWLQIERVEALSEAGEGILLRPIDKNDIRGEAMTEYNETPGTPDKYDFNGTSIILKPASSYDKESGVKIYFNRAPSYFASTDTTKRPGFATIFHPYLSMYATNQWNIIKRNDFSLQAIIDRTEKEIGLFYSKRPKYEVARLTRANKSWK